MNIVTLTTSFSLFFSSALASDVKAARPTNPHAGLTLKLSQCVGKLQAVGMYDGYVESLARNRFAAEDAMQKLMPVIGVSDPSFYVEEAASARVAYVEEIVAKPRLARENIGKLILDCQLFITQAKEFRDGLNRREKQALDAQRVEQEARLKLEMERQQHRLEQERIAAETEKARAELELSQATEANREKEFQRARELALIDKSRAEAAGEIAVAEAKKAEMHNVRLERGKVEIHETGQGVGFDPLPKENDKTAAAEVAATDEETTAMRRELQAMMGLPSFSLTKDMKAQVLKCSAFFLAHENAAPGLAAATIANTGKGMYYIAVAGGVPPEAIKAESERMPQTIKSMGGGDGRHSTAIKNLRSHCLAVSSQLEDIIDRARGAEMGL